MTALCPGSRQRPTRFVATLAAICDVCGRTVGCSVDGRVVRHDAVKVEARS